MADSQAPTGLARRGRRLPEDETEQRMLRAALAMVHQTGLTVSLEHISFEDVIRRGRRVPQQRLPPLAAQGPVLQRPGPGTRQEPDPGIVTDEMDLIRRIVAGRLDRLATPQSRRALVIELFRQLSVLDFETLYASPGWRTYLALHATFLSLADGGLRDQVQAALAQAEQDHLARVARAWELMAGLLGFRLRAESGVTFETLADAGQRHHAGPGHDGPDRARHRRARAPPPSRSTRPRPASGRSRRWAWAPWPSRSWSPIRSSSGMPAAQPPSATRSHRRTWARSRQATMAMQEQPTPERGAGHASP